MMFNKIKNTVKWVKTHRKLLFLLLVIVAMLVLGGCIDQPLATVAMTIVPGVAGGKHVVDGPLATDVAREASPELLLNEVDRQIAKIRPMATPIDQLSRHAASKHAASMVVDYYNVDTKPTSAVLTTAVDEDEQAEGGTDNPKVRLVTDNDIIFDVSDTILVQGVKGYDATGTVPTTDELVLYVASRDDLNGLQVTAVNGKTVAGVHGCVPSIDAGTKLIRMGRAATELDVMSPLFESLPTKSQNYCQIFKMQVEQSTLFKLSRKEAPWNLTDQEEAAIYDLRMGMEKSYLFGVKARIYDTAKKENVYLTGGIWNQAGKQFNYNGSFTQDGIVDLMRDAFTGNAGSKRKILVGGSTLISSLNKIDYTRVVTTTQNVTKWGIDFAELRSKFGTLYVMMSEVFDEVGMASDGIIIDPEYLTKYTHVPFSTQKLDLKASGQRNVDAIVLTEASCLVLRYPGAHMRVVKR